MTPPTRFAVDDIGLEEARKLVGLRLPVVVSRLHMKHWGGRYLGVHHKRDAHHVTCAAGESPELAQRVILHELGHALQLERIYDELMGDGALPVGTKLATAGRKGRAAWAMFNSRWWDSVMGEGLSRRDVITGRASSGVEEKREMYERAPMERDAQWVADHFDSKVDITTLPEGRPSMVVSLGFLLSKR